MKGHVRACGGADWSARSVGVLCEDWSRWRHKGAWERLNATAGLRRCICIIIHSVCVGGGGGVLQLILYSAASPRTFPWQRQQYP